DLVVLAWPGAAVGPTVRATVLASTWGLSSTRSAPARSGMGMPLTTEGEEHEGEEQGVGASGWTSCLAGQLECARGVGCGEATLPELVRVREHPQRIDQGHLAEAAQSLRLGLEA